MPILFKYSASDQMYYALNTTHTMPDHSLSLWLLLFSSLLCDVRSSDSDTKMKWCWHTYRDHCGYDAPTTGDSIYFAVHAVCRMLKHARDSLYVRSLIHFNTAMWIASYDSVTLGSIYRVVDACVNGYEPTCLDLSLLEYVRCILHRW